MKNILSFLLIIYSFLALGQTKEKLIQTMIDYNVFESDCVGIACSPSEQFKRFEKLKSLISEKELLQLARHKEPVIRAYVSTELVKNNKEVIQLFSYEIDRNETVETQDGCFGDYKDLSWVIYNAYKWKVALKSIIKADTIDEVRNLKIANALAQDSTFQKLNSIILHSDKDLYYLFYYLILKDEKVDEDLIPRLKVLAFKQNNSFAFDRIAEKYPDDVKKYFENDFLNADFNSSNKVWYLDRFVEYLLESQDENYKELVLQKLKKDNYWRKHLNMIEQKLEKYRIVL
jgi:hypothetical protein